ncbi:hypothetical protein Aperf_G00000032085 [Anoplocephala perfoliata]
MANLTGGLDCIKAKKYKKTTGYDAKLAKLVTKAKKSKIGKENYEVKSVGNLMKFQSLGKKASPIGEIDYSRIKNLSKTSPAEKTMGFAYPSSSAKTPTMLYAMRFKKEADYNNFLERIEAKPADRRNFEERSPSPLRTSRYTDSGLNNQEEPRQMPSSASKTGEQSRGRTEPHFRSHSWTDYEQTSTVSSSTPKPKRGSPRNSSVVSYISNDKLFPPHHRRGRSPVITVRSPFEATYIPTKSAVRKSPSPSRRAHSARPRSQLSGVRLRKIYLVSRLSSSSSSDSSSTSSSDSLSSTSSNDSSSVSGQELIGENIPGGRSFVISRCSRDKKSGFRCHPVGEITVTPDTPSFTYEA